MFHRGVKRRDFVKSIGALGAAGLLPACGDHDTPGIRHVVYLMMENRSYDHWLGARGMIEGLPGDGLRAGMSNADANGVVVPSFPATPAAYCVPDPPHGWDAAHAQFAGGANSGFVVAHQQEHPGDLSVMQYMQRADLPVTWALADAYASCDRWFASVMGPTWPNRMYWLSGTSMGMNHNALPPGGYTAPTIFDRLDEVGVDWKIYYGDLPFAALLGSGVKVDFDGRLQRMMKFFDDCAAGALPTVTYLDPPFAYGDDHPPHDPSYGQAFLASVYNALASSPLWPHCLLLVTYDEHGGMFDHVPPPKTADDRAADGFDQLGFRVPALAIGPYVKAGHVSSVVRDHTSALRHLEATFGTAPLTARSSAAADLWELLDEDRLARGEPAAPIELPAVTADVTMIPPQCQDGGSGVAAHPVIAAADAHPAWIARWDARADAPALWREISARSRGRRR
jgi:phospholipase C